MVPLPVTLRSRVAGSPPSSTGDPDEERAHPAFLLNSEYAIRVAFAGDSLAACERTGDTWSRTKPNSTTLTNQKHFTKLEVSGWAYVRFGSCHH